MHLIWSKNKEMLANNVKIAFQAWYLKYLLLTMEGNQILNVDKIWHNWQKLMKSFVFDSSDHKLNLQIDIEQPDWY